MDINRIAYNIVEGCKTREDYLLIVNSLSGVDIESLFSQRDRENVERQIRYEEEEKQRRSLPIYYCCGCNRKDYLHLYVQWDKERYPLDAQRSKFNGLYHPECLERAISDYRINYEYVCIICGGAFITYNIAWTAPLCGNCRNAFTIKEYRRINAHIARSRKYGVAHTLTLAEWIKNIEYFGRKCAYCGFRNFEVLEHFVPVKLGGGTTKDNCVPGCTACNIIKKSDEPMSTAEYFKPGTIDRINMYLLSLRDC